MWDCGTGSGTLLFSQTNRKLRGMTNSNISVQPYLFFNGRCEEALEFYRSAVGAEVEMLSRFKDAPEPGMT